MERTFRLDNTLEYTFHSHHWSPQDAGKRVVAREVFHVNLRFALNHMAAPQLDLPAFFGLARGLGITEVEIRNDIAGKPIADGTAAAKVRTLAEEAGVAIITINALQRFNHWSPEREAEAVALARYARDSGSRALILVPANDGTGRADGERQRNVRTALKALSPVLSDAGITGLVEPLGFEICSLRSKREAADAIREIGGPFKITHDTFHHHLAGEPDIVPELTGLVHISGVVDPKLSVGEMRDAHRVLVDARDRLGSIEQIEALTAGGYAGPLSFEPFADELRTLPDPARAIGDSMNFIRTRLASKAA
jgi:2-keto-myo-inositol isomerase